MAKSVDDRVVAMAFENGKFEANAKQTLGTLDKLKQSLNFGNTAKSMQDVSSASDKLKQSLQLSGSAKGLQEVAAASNNVKLGHISNAVDGIRQKFSAMSVVGIAALSALTAKAVTAGLDITKAFTVAPSVDGFREYELKLNSIQTILANTQASGATIKDVTAALDELNEYADRTIYNFGQMARNVGTFTAAGVDLKTSTAAIKGIANVAAMSGTNSEEAARAMYQLSQALSSGKVALKDWISVENAGMANASFKRNLVETAVAMGKLDKDAVKMTGKMKNVTIAGQSFRDSISAKGKNGETWLTSDVLLASLKQFTGDLTDGQLAAMGFTKAQIKSIQAQAQTANDAATKVKTLTQLLQTSAESAGSGWAQSWEIIFGNLEEARTAFTGASEVIGGFLQRSADARNALLSDWKKLGGRTELIKSISNTFEALVSVLKPIKDAFREIFPAKTGQQLYDMTVRLREFTETLKIGPETADRLKRTFAGLFAVLSIGKSIISGVFSVITRLLGVVGEGSGGFLEFTASIGDFLVSLDSAIKDSKSFAEVFDRIGDVLEKPIRLLQQVGAAIGGLFSGGSGAGAAALEKSLSGIEIVLTGIIDLFKNLGKAVVEALSGADFDTVLDILRTGLLAGIAVLIKRFFDNFSLDLTGGLLGNISDSFTQLTGTLKAMQTGVQADTIMKIAIAVGILAVSVVALSKIDGESLSRALTGLGIAFVELLAAMAIIAKISATGGFVKIPILAASMIMLAAAINLLVVAVYALSKLSWEELSKGLTGVAVLLAAISAASIPLSANSGGMIRAGVGIVAIAVAMKILASAVKDFGSMEWSTIGKGLASVTAALIGIGLAMNLVPPTIAVTGAGLVVVAVGLKLLAGVIKTFGEMDLASTGKGLGIIVASIVALGVAVMALPKTLVIQAAGLMLLSVALASIAGSIGLMGSMSMETLARGLGSLAGALLILAIGLKAMSGSLGGAAALTVAAGALMLLVPPLLLLGQQSWGTIVKGLASLAGAFLVIGAAGALLGPVAPALLALGASLLVLGVAMLALGGGVALLGTGLAAIAVSGPAAIAILVKALVDLIKVVPVFIEGIVKGLLLLVQGIAAQAPAFAAALGQILVSLLNTVITAAPQLGQAFLVLLSTALGVIKTAVPMFVATGLSIIMSLVQGLTQNIGPLVSAAANLIVNFLTALTSQLPQLISAGARFVLSLLRGIEQNIGQITKEALTVVTNFLKGVSSKIADVVAAGVKILAAVIRGLGQNAAELAKAGGEAIAKFIRGLGEAASDVVKAGVDAAGKFIKGVAEAAVDLAEAGADAIIAFLRGLADMIEQKTPEIMEAGVQVGVALGKGVAKGIASMGGEVIKAATDLAGKALGPLKKIPKIFSPSKVTTEYGKNIAEGLILGMTVKIPDAVAASNGLADSIIMAFHTKFRSPTSSETIASALNELLTTGLEEGLAGTGDDIDAVFMELNNSILSTIQSFKDEIKTRKDLRTSYRNQKEHTKAETQEYQLAGKQIESYQKNIKKLITQREKVVSQHDLEIGRLKALKVEYANYTEQLTAAQSALDNAISLRDNFAASTSDKFSILPAIDNSDENQGKQLTTYLSDLTNYYHSVVMYRQLLDQLRAAGLDDATYKMLLDQGVAGLNFAQQLMDAGPGAIAQINDIDSKLQAEARALGGSAATSMFQAGVDAAQGLVDGLNKTLNDPKTGIAAQMEKIADKLVKALRKKLKIKSPSRVLTELGEFTGQGLANGLINTTKSVTDASENLANDAISAMQKSMSMIPSAIASDIEVNPVITPVLDLTTLRADAKQFSDLSNVIPITASASYNQAAAISSLAEEAYKAIAENKEVSSVTFEQNNYSPEALSALDIYRQTNNQLSRAKAALA